MNLRLTGFQKLALVSVFATWVMVVIGVIVRSTGSGMGCPDWPLCYGEVIPPLGDTGAWLESIHRWWGVIVGFIVLALGIQAWRVHRATRSIVVAALAVIVLTGFQAWLGKWTVESANSNDSVTAHLAASMLILGAAIFVFVRSRYAPGLPERGRTQGTTLVVLFATASVFVLMLFGSIVTVNAASLASL